MLATTDSLIQVDQERVLALEYIDAGTASTGDAFREQIERTDIALQKLKAALTEDGHRSQLEQIAQVQEELVIQRRKVEERNALAGEVRKAHRTASELLLECSYAQASEFVTTEALRLATSICDLLTIEDSLAREHSLINHVLRIDAISDQEFDEWNSLRLTQRELMTRIARLASRNGIPFDAVVNAANSPTHAEMLALRNEIEPLGRGKFTGLEYEKWNSVVADWHSP